MCPTKAGIFDDTLVEMRVTTTAPSMSRAQHCLALTFKCFWSPGNGVDTAHCFQKSRLPSCPPTVSDAGVGTGTHSTLAGWQGCLVALTIRSSESKQWQRGRGTHLILPTPGLRTALGRPQGQQPLADPRASSAKPHSLNTG